ncbi:MAG TPA: helix-turn-helix transcriptional regulator [Candidatus Dormibacteraeota bacterium]|nr:helix-turn-helix transcriptional regulator [Candidatus Dormibacteraeota bacterium]
MAGPEPRRPVGRPEAVQRTLGERIHRYRVRAGLSRTQLSGLIGKSPSWLYKVERGVLAPPDRISVLSELARVLRIEVDDLLIEPVSPAAADAVRRAAASATERVATGRARSQPAAAPVAPVTPPIEAFNRAAHPAAAPSPPPTPTIDRRAVPSVRSRAASGAAGRRRWRVWTVVPAMAVTATATTIALVAVLPDPAHHTTRTRLRDQAAVPQGVLAAPAPVIAPVDVAPAPPAPELPPAAPPPSMRPVAAVVSSAAIHPAQGTAAVPRPAVSSTPSSSPACSRVAFDGDTGPMSPDGGWVYRLTVRPGGSVCASWDSPEVEGALLGPGLMQASTGNGTLTGTNLPGGTYTLALRPRAGARSDHTHVRIAFS